MEIIYPPHSSRLSKPHNYLKQPFFKKVELAVSLASIEPMCLLHLVHSTLSVLREQAGSNLTSLQPHVSNIINFHYFISRAEHLFFIAPSLHRHLELAYVCRLGPRLCSSIPLSSAAARGSSDGSGERQSCTWCGRVAALTCLCHAHRPPPPHCHTILQMRTKQRYLFG